MENSFKLAMIYIGMIVGAGFLSGQEILSFFVVYGKASFLGVLIASILFGLCAYLVLRQILRKKEQNYSGHKIISNKFINFLLTLFMLLTYSIMQAGAAGIFYEYLSLPKLLGSLSFSFICYQIFKSRSHGLVSANMYLIPIMIFGSLLIASYSIIFKVDPVINLESLKYVSNNWFISSIFYVSYNVLGSIGVMSSVPDLIDSKKTCLLSSAIIMVMVFLMCSSLWFALYKSYDLIKNSSIPILMLSGILKPFYVCLLFIAMLTTAVSSGFGTINNINTQFKNLNYDKLTIIITIIGLVISQAGFSLLVSKIYYIYGLIGIFIFPLGLKNIQISQK